MKNILLILVLISNIAKAESMTTVEWDVEHHLKADIYEPDSKNIHPAVLLIHGGGWMAGDRRELQWFGENLAKNGFVAISIDYRLVNKKTSAFEQYSDIKNALRTIINNANYLNIDPNRIGVLGGSAGGHLAAMIATEPNTPIKAAVILWGPTNLTDLTSLSLSGHKIIDRYFDLNPNMDKKAFSPVLRLNDKMCKNWILIHGEIDELVPLKQSISMNQELLKHKVNSQMTIVPGMNHSPHGSIQLDSAIFSLQYFLKVNLMTEVK